MRMLKKLNENIESLSGIPIADVSQDRPMTYKAALVAVCELHKPMMPGYGEALKAFDLGIKLQNSKEEIELNDEDVNFLKTIIDKNTIFLSVITGRLLHYLNNVKVEDPKLKH